MLTRRNLIATTAAGVTAASIAPRPQAATPANIQVEQDAGFHPDSGIEPV